MVCVAEVVVAAAIVIVAVRTARLLRCVGNCDSYRKEKQYEKHTSIIDKAGSGGFAITRDKAKLPQKCSVNVTKNDDSNCFWYALAVAWNLNHRNVERIKKGRGDIRTNLAK